MTFIFHFDVLKFVSVFYIKHISELQKYEYKDVQNMTYICEVHTVNPRKFRTDVFCNPATEIK